MDRDDIATEFLTQLPFAPYPVQEEALLAWFTSDQGVMVCAPTGTGKTLIAEGALYEALKQGRTSYYTTPLIALTEQKFRELQEKVVSWGYRSEDVGLVTGHRRENPQAKILVVVAEILLNRLLHHEFFDFGDVESVVMDEFHSFNDRERGVVWELTLSLLPPHVRTLLLSATVGNAYPFCRWLEKHHHRSLQLIESQDRKVPLTFEWVGDQLLNEQLTLMAQGDDEARRTPSLVFCFNRDECWNVAEQLKGKDLIDKARQAELVERLKEFDWTEGAGPKLKQILQRGVGVHHAGVLPKYRRVVEDLFQDKLLSVCVCTETLAAGVNLPARSVVLPTILKGPATKKQLVGASSAHQIFGRAGRPQFDQRGYVYVMASEDDVKIARWKAKFDQIPADTKDLGLRKAKKALKKKMPKRRANMQYWHEAQFEKLKAAPPDDLASRGDVPWRMLAHLLEVSPEVTILRELVSKRLLNTTEIETAQRRLDRMLITLWRAGYVTLKPLPPMDATADDYRDSEAPDDPAPREPPPTLMGVPLPVDQHATVPDTSTAADKPAPDSAPPARYRPELAEPTERLARLRCFRSVNPLFGVFLVNHLGIADQNEMIQAIESCLEMPGTVARHLRVPKDHELPPGPLAKERLDEQLISFGLATAEEIQPPPDEEREFDPYNPPPPPLTLARKLRMLFDFEFPQVEGLRTTPVWAAGELLVFGGDFNKFIVARKLQKQEGVVFRHLLRMVLLIAEFAQLTPPEVEPAAWQSRLDAIRLPLVESCQYVDRHTTEKILSAAEHAKDDPFDPAAT